MTLANKLLCTLFLIVLVSLPTSFAQTIEWEYELQDELQTTVRNFWIDDDGNGYYNISLTLVQNQSAAVKESFLLKLDPHGRYDGSVYVNQCQSRAPLYPFGKRRFITSGSNCTGDDRPRRQLKVDTRVFNHRGKLIQTGDRFPGFTRGAVFHNEEITFFNKPNNDWGYSFLSIGKVSQDVEISYDSISLEPLRNDEYGIMLAGREPVAVNNDTWIVPYAYGMIEGGRYKERLAIKHGLLMAVKDQEIQWTFPNQLDHRQVHGLCVHNDRIGVIRSASWVKRPKEFSMLDANGTVLKTAQFPAYSVRDMDMTDDFFVVLEAKKLSWYNFDGELQTEFILEDYGLSKPWRMQMLKDGSVVFCARKGENAVIVKLRNDQNETILEEMAEPRAVAYSSIEEVSSETISIAVYPNPASIDITFEVDQEVDITAGFFLQIFTTSGQLIHEAQFNAQRHEVYVDELPAGTYFYRIAYQKDQERQLIQGKFVKV